MTNTSQAPEPRALAVFALAAICLTRYRRRASASSSLEIELAELARVQVFGIPANSATPKVRFDEALACAWRRQPAQHMTLSARDRLSHSSEWSQRCVPACD